MDYKAKFAKFGLSPSKKVDFFYFNESALKIMFLNNVFYFILKALFVLKIFTLWS